MSTFRVTAGDFRGENLRNHMGTLFSKVYVTCAVVLSCFTQELSSLGKVRTDTIKRISRELVRRFPDRFAGEWEADKENVNQLVTTQSKRLRNRIAGYVTRLKVVEAERAAATQVAAEGSESGEPAPSDVE
jgi:small subunit ribosomal protein S17e